MLNALPIKLHEAEHSYEWLGSPSHPEKVILEKSVTEVCGWDNSREKTARIAATRDIWEPRGLACHSALEKFFKSGVKETNEGPYKNWINPLLRKEYWYEFQPLLVEGRLCDLKKSVGGSLDVLGLDKEGKVILMDLKTTSRSGRTYSTDRQLGAYASMFIDHYRMPIDEIRTIWCTPSKTTISPDQGVDKCIKAWLDCWQLYNWGAIKGPFDDVPITANAVSAFRERQERAPFAGISSHLL